LSADLIDARPIADPMLRNLFPGLTRAPSRGCALFEALVGEARRAHWFVDGKVPDTLDGRFAVLSTIVALATVRLERGGARAHEQAVAVAERFVEAMDAEHRQLGIGEPALGKTVRRLVGALARRVGLWRSAIDGTETWRATVAASLFPAGPPSEAAAKHCNDALRDYWARLERSADEALAEGRIA
jgi:cytochrome b pre-mRNA-processing protein 3